MHGTTSLCRGTNGYIMLLVLCSSLTRPGLAPFCHAATSSPPNRLPTLPRDHCSVHQRSYQRSFQPTHARSGFIPNVGGGPPAPGTGGWAPYGPGGGGPCPFAKPPGPGGGGRAYPGPVGGNGGRPPAGVAPPYGPWLSAISYLHYDRKAVHSQTFGVMPGRIGVCLYPAGGPPCMGV